jgi:hypothetical protein
VTLFGSLDLRLDPWQPEYGSEVPAAQAPEEVAVELGVERPAEAWQALAPAATGLPPRVAFVDGVRRVEARVLARRGGQLCHGVFGSFGVGSVLVQDGRAVEGEGVIDRVLALGAGESLPGPIPVAPAVVYRTVSTSDPRPDAALARLQDEMRLAEEHLARRLADEPETLVVADGPLTFGEPVRGAAVGFVKRLFELYLPASHLGLLATLPPGRRTPLFALRAARRFGRYAWFLRLVAPRRGEADLAGLARLEVADGVGLEAARRLADATAAFLPRFVPERARDPRAPQNLLPIGALEASLRHRLGDPLVIRRAIEALVHAEAAA